ncbi:flagellar filament capping protein FliD [Paenibacillus faecalis]|uniref:flagellar filament capping protein FliD n=1 Tax=Paenibacillus faecalis TaxID=2079532 RepID=UPI000D10F029|nr:flagellar filament capping protein FliD [Paenibacillus faecalis]
MRVSGLASGIDIDSIVQEMMVARRAPLDKLNQNKQVLEWKRESYKTVNSAIVDFRQNKLDKYRMPSEMNVFTSQVTGNKDAISVRATTSANQVPMSVEVERLATQTTLKTASLGEGTSVHTRIGTLASGSAPFTFEVTRGGETIKVDFDSNATIKDVLTKLNSDTKLGVVATFDEAGKNIIIKSKEYGSSDVKFGGTLLTDAFKFNLTNPEESTIDMTNQGAQYVKGHNASVTINGAKFEPSSNVLTVNGVEITLLQPTGDTNAEITTKADGSKAIETIKAFIEDYNTLIATLNSKVSEQRYRDFFPLSAEQKKEMTEDDIKNWEAKAKSGLLRNDDILVEGLTNMRTLLSTSYIKHGEQIINLSSIGITTGAYTEDGKLYLNEEKLKQAIEDNPEQVMELFSGSSDGSTKGIFDNMYDQLYGTLTRLSDKAGTNKFSTDLTIALNEQSTMGKELTDLKDRIDDLGKKLIDIENRYYAQFTAMEKAINQMNAQSASLAGFMA